MLHDQEVTILIELVNHDQNAAIGGLLELLSLF